MILEVAEEYKAIGTFGNSWHYGFLFKNEDRAWILVPNDQFLDSPSMIEVYPDSVCKFTGVYDFNRRPLYENDKIKVNGYDTHISFDEGSFYHTAYSDHDFLSQAEIIYTGNIIEDEYGANPKEEGRFLTRRKKKGSIEYSGEDQDFVMFSILALENNPTTLGIGADDLMAFLTKEQVEEVIPVLKKFVEEGKI